VPKRENAYVGTGAQQGARLHRGIRRTKGPSGWVFGGQMGQCHRIVAFEALARWNHVLAGAISPEQFIPIAAESGLIDDLGDFVLRSARTQWQAHLANSSKCMRLAVNVSVR